MDGVIWQTNRQGNKPLLDSIDAIFRIDPVLLVLTAAGFVFAAAIKRDFFVLLWFVPFVIFYLTIGFINWFYWIPIIPAFCITTARMIVELSRRVNNNEKIQQIILYAIISEIAIFAMVSTTTLLNTNVSFFQFQAAAFVAQHLRDDNNTNNYKGADDVTIISGPIYAWIFKYVFDKDHVFIYSRLNERIQTNKLLLIVDNYFMNSLSRDRNSDEDNKTDRQIEKLQRLYDDTDTIATFKGNTSKYDQKIYPYASMKYNYGGSKVLIRTNY
jgi:hypothetical protein